MTKDNHFLAKIQVDGIPPMPKGVPRVEVSFEIDADGIITVSTLEKSTGKAQTLTISNESALTMEEIELHVAEAERCVVEDNSHHAARVEVTESVENYLLSNEPYFPR
jgi:molecular chaperone DnaK (HSP70)